MPTGDGHRSRGRRGRGPAVAWEVVGMSGGDQDKWLEPAFQKLKALAFPNSLSSLSWGGWASPGGCLQTPMVS